MKISRYIVLRPVAVLHMAEYEHLAAACLDRRVGRQRGERLHHHVPRVLGAPRLRPLLAQRLSTCAVGVTAAAAARPIRALIRGLGPHRRRDGGCRRAGALDSLDS